MTIGIAALCLRDDKAVLVTAADTQLSRGFTSSMAGLKIQTLPGRWNALIAAENLAHAEAVLDGLIPRMVKRQAGLAVGARFTVEAFRDEVRDAYAAAHSELAEACLPPGLTLERFYAEGRTLFPDRIYDALWSDVTQNLGCSLLFVGFDDYDDRPHALTLTRGQLAGNSRIGFAAVGSGAPLAIAVMSAWDHMRVADWEDTVYRVFAAKKTSERATGVGPHTILQVLTSDGLDWIDAGALDEVLRRYGPLPPDQQRIALRDELRQPGAIVIESHTPWRKSSAESPASATPSDQAPSSPPVSP